MDPRNSKDTGTGENKEKNGSHDKDTTGAGSVPNSPRDKKPKTEAEEAGLTERAPSPNYMVAGKV